MPSKLVIDIVKLPSDDKVIIEAELDPKELDMEFDDFHYQSKLAINGSLEKVSDVLLFNGEIETTVESICGRCLTEQVEKIIENFDFTFDVKDEIELDVTGDLREVMMIAHPQKFLCSEDCKGLCAGCGVNLNNEPCECRK